MTVCKQYVTNSNENKNSFNKLVLNYYAACYTILIEYEKTKEEDNMKTFIKKKLNDKGLTLVELLAVIVILGIIAAIAVPAIGNIITNSKVSALKADGQNAISAANIYFAESTAAENTVKVTDLLAKGYLEDIGGFKGDATAEVTRAEGSEDKGTTLTVKGKASNGNTAVEFKSATNADINKVGTKNDAAVTTVDITR